MEHGVERLAGRGERRDADRPSPLEIHPESVLSFLYGRVGGTGIEQEVVGLRGVGRVT